MAHFEVLLRGLPGGTGKPRNNSVMKGDGRAGICIRDIRNLYPRHPEFEGSVILIRPQRKKQEIDRKK
jgi:hypothetical protein